MLIESLMDIQKIRIIFPEAEKLNPLKNPDAWAAVLDKQGKRLGHIAVTTPYADHITGFGGPVPLMIGIDLSEKIVGVIILSHSETPGFVKNFEKQGFLTAFQGIQWKDAGNRSWDTVSGATMTSKAVIESLLFRLDQLKGLPSSEKPVTQEKKTLKTF